MLISLKKYYDSSHMLSTSFCQENSSTNICNSKCRASTSLEYCLPQTVVPGDRFGSRKRCMYSVVRMVR